MLEDTSLLLGCPYAQCVPQGLTRPGQECLVYPIVIYVGLEPIKQGLGCLAHPSAACVGQGHIKQGLG